MYPSGSPPRCDRGNRLAHPQDYYNPPPSLPHCPFEPLRHPHDNHTGYRPGYWPEQYYHEESFGYPTTTNTSYDSTRCCSPFDIALYNHSEIGNSLNSSMSFSMPTSPPNEREIEDRQNRSIDSGYGDGMRGKEPSGKRKWSTIRQPLPKDELLAARVVKRRLRNKQATAKSRERLQNKAAKGEHYERVLIDVGGHLENIVEELKKLQTAGVSKLLRGAGVDPGHLMGEINKLTEYITKEVKGTLDNM